MNRFILVFMISVLLTACQSARPKPPLTITPFQTAARPTPTADVITPTLTPTRVLPSATPSVVPTRTATPTPAPMSVVKEENGWVTYRNEIIGYEISAPKSYRVIGHAPWFGHGLLGPAVPDEEIDRLLARYYGESLDIWIREPDPSGQPQPRWISVSAYDLLVKTLGATMGLGGMGDYELAKARETLTIDGQSYAVPFTVMLKHNQAVGELARLYLEKDGIEITCGYTPAEDHPEAYQAYRKEIWPVVRRIIESYKHLPEK